MSLMPGDLKLKDPASIRNAQFNWDAFLAAGVQIAGAPTIVASGNDALLVIANVALASGNRKVNYRVSGGTLGLKYTVTSQITTNEASAQTEERSFDVHIVQM